MTLSAGTRLGPYEVSAPLGAGGMGEVYRARDSRLGREVALKVLPEALSTDKDRLARFEQEARSASALNHPNIVTIYDIGQAGSVAYMAMELVEGTSLRELSPGPLPIRRALQIAFETSEGLAKAHTAGIVHRDLKPENLMISKDGFVKILDFGLAKLVVGDSGGVSAMPTQVKAETLPGTVMGTVAYMSPEQASGQPLDYRSDQFSLGSILYEILTGRKAFQKATAAQTMAAIIQEEPDPIAQLRPEIPAPVRWIVERCLSKEPRARYTSTEDLARELATVRDHLSEASSSAAVVIVPRSRARAPLWLFAALLPLALFGLWSLANRRPPKTAASLPTFRQVTFRRANVWNAQFAPDGETIVYTVFAQGRPELFSTRVGSRESRPLGISPANILAISSAGEMALSLGVGFGRGTLAQAPLAGGAPRELLESVRGADWSPDGKSLAVGHVVEGKTRLEFPIGKVLVETTGGARLRVSRKGDLVAINERGTLSVVDLTGRKRSLAKDSHEFGWSPASDELWFNRIVEGATQIHAVSLTGEERALASFPGDFSLYDVSRNGRILVERGSERLEVLGRFPGSDGERSLTWLDSTGACDLSADGTTFLFSEREAAFRNADVYVRKTDGSPAVRLGKGFCRTLSLDGKWVISLPENPAPRLILLPTGAGQPIHLRNDGLQPFDIQDSWANWLPDGKRILFAGRAIGEQPRLFLQDVPDGKPRPISPEGVRLPRATAVSPDGRFVFALGKEGWFLYSLDGGKPRPLPGLSEGDEPIGWTADGALYVLKMEAAPMRIWSLNIENGRRRLSKEIPFPDAEAVNYLDRIIVTPDARWYVHSYSRWLADLFVIEGVK